MASKKTLGQEERAAHCRNSTDEKVWYQSSSNISSVKRACCFPRGPTFSSQNPLQVQAAQSHLELQSQGDLTPSTGFHKCVHRHTPTHTKWKQTFKEIGVVQWRRSFQLWVKEEWRVRWHWRKPVKLPPDPDMGRLACRTSGQREKHRWLLSWALGKEMISYIAVWPKEERGWNTVRDGAKLHH